MESSKAIALCEASCVHMTSINRPLRDTTCRAMYLVKIIGTGPGHQAFESTDRQVYKVAVLTVVGGAYDTVLPNAAQDIRRVANSALSTDHSTIDQ